MPKVSLNSSPQTLPCGEDGARDVVLFAGQTFTKMHLATLRLGFMSELP